jgi:hypothetical protein
MSNLNNFQSDVEILRMAEQERSKVIGTFFRWLFAKRDHTTSPDHSSDAVAAE